MAGSAGRIVCSGTATIFSADNIALESAGRRCYISRMTANRRGILRISRPVLG